MTGVALSEELSRLMSVFGISADDLAMVLHTDRRTVYRWLADETYPQHDSRSRLQALTALEHRLRESFVSPEGARTWLQSESGYFGGLCPRDALLRGRIDAVNASLEALDTGSFV